MYVFARVCSLHHWSKFYYFLHMLVVLDTGADHWQTPQNASTRSKYVDEKRCITFVSFNRYVFELLRAHQYFKIAVTISCYSRSCSGNTANEKELAWIVQLQENVQANLMHMTSASLSSGPIGKNSQGLWTPVSATWRWRVHMWSEKHERWYPNDIPIILPMQPGVRSGKQYCSHSKMLVRLQLQ